MSEKTKEYLTDEEKSELCLQCHRCCKHLPISLGNNPEMEVFQHIMEYYKAHGCDTMVFGKSVIISIPHVCQHLTEKGCAIYDKRPTVCREYDGRKDPRMYKECLWARWKPKGGMRTHAAVADQAEVKLS